MEWAKTSHSYECSVRNIKGSTYMNIVSEIQGQYCHEYSLRNIGAIKKRISQRVKITTHFGLMVCTNKRNKLIGTLIFGRMVMHKGRMYERGSYILVEWSYANKINKSMSTLISGRMVVCKRKNK